MDQTAATVGFDEMLPHAAWLRSLARGLLGTGADVDDVVQETLIAGWRRPPLQGNTRGWLSTVLLNRVRAEARRNKAHGRALAVLPEVPAATSPEQVNAQLDLQRRILSVMAELPQEAQQLLFLRYFEELDSPEIGRRLAVPAGTVRWRLKNALADLRSRLDADDGAQPSSWRAVLAPLATSPAAKTPAFPALALSAAVIAVVAIGAVALWLGTKDGVTAPSLPSTLVARTAATSEPAQAQAQASGLTAAAPSPSLTKPVTTATASAGQGNPARVPRFVLAETANDRPSPLLSTPRFDATVTGISEAVRGALPEIKSCYDAWLKVSPKLGGRLQVAFTISPGAGGAEHGHGRISKTRIDNGTVGNAMLEGCVLSVFEDIRFDNPDDEVEVVFPIIMSSSDDGEDGND